MDSAQVIQFPQPQRQLGTARITALSNGMPTQCQLVHHPKTLKVISLVDIAHQWQQDETVTVLYHKNRAIITGTNDPSDKQFNLDVQLQNNITNLVFGQDITGKKITRYTFLGKETNITISSSGSTNKLHFDYETLDNDGIWCLMILGFKFYVI